MVEEWPQLARRYRSVALVGMDGSGKSTMAEWLRQRLKEQRKSVLLVHPFGRKLLSFLPAGSRSRVGAGAGSGRAGWAGRRLGQLAAVVELTDIAAYVWVAHIRSFALAQRAGGEAWLVSDRSFDDLLVKHRRLRTLSARSLTRARRLVPAAQITIWLRTEPEIAMGRDGDFAADYYQELHATYASAAEQYGWNIVDTSNRSRAAVAADIECLLWLSVSDVREP